MRIIFSLLVLLGMGELSAQWQVETPVRFLALGDSYTIGQGVSTSSRWPVQLLDSLQARGYSTDTLAIIATTGWRTDQLLNAIAGKQLAQKQFNMVSLLIGVNNQYQNRPLAQYRPELEALIDSALRYVGGQTERVFVLSIPDYAYTPFGQQGNPFAISQQIDIYNTIKRDVCDSLGIAYFNITDISRQGLTDPTLVATDQLHPSGRQYGLWVQRLMAYVDSVSTLGNEQWMPSEQWKIERHSEAWRICNNQQNEWRYRLWDLHGRLLQQEEAIAGGHCVTLAETWRNFGMLLLEVRDAAGNVGRFRLY